MGANYFTCLQSCNRDRDLDLSSMKYNCTDEYNLEYGFNVESVPSPVSKRSKASSLRRNSKE